MSREALKVFDKITQRKTEMRRIAIRGIEALSGILLFLSLN